MIGFSQFLEYQPQLEPESDPPLKNPPKVTPDPNQVQIVTLVPSGQFQPITPDPIQAVTPVQIPPETPMTPATPVTPVTLEQFQPITPDPIQLVTSDEIQPVTQDEIQPVTIDQFQPVTPG